MPPAYEAKFTTAAHVQGIVVKDSGFVTFSPPSCYRISLSVSKNETSTCGDTTWIRSADGSVTVTANKNTMGRISHIFKEFKKIKRKSKNFLRLL